MKLAFDRFKEANFLDVRDTNILNVTIIEVNHIPSGNRNYKIRLTLNANVIMHYSNIGK